MGIQEEIDSHLFSESNPCPVIFVENMAGDATVPEGIVLRLYNCSIGTLRVGRECTVHIKGGDCREVTFESGCQFNIEDCSPLQKIIVTGSKGVIWRNVLGKMVIKQFEIYDGSSVELIDLDHEYEHDILKIEKSYVSFLRSKALIPISGVTGDASTMVFSGCYFTQTTGNVILGRNRSCIRISDSHIEGFEVCPALTVEGQSVAVVTQGDGYCPADKGLFSGQWVIKASQGSYVKVKDSMIVGSPGHYSDYGILCEDFSTVEAVGDSVVRIDGGAFPAIEVNNHSTVSVTNYNRIWCESKEAIKCSGNSRVKVFGLKNYIKSDQTDAIWIRDNSRVDVYDVPLIYAPNGDGVDMQNCCDFVAVNIEDRINGILDYGVKAVRQCNVKLDGVNNCKGDGEDGVYLEDHCRLIAVRGNRIEGVGDNGVEAKNNCQVIIVDYTGEVVGTASDGIHLEDACTATLFYIEKIRGMGEDGIYMKRGCVCHSRGCNYILGEGRDGVEMTDECRYTSIGDKEIRGKGRDGIHGEDNCQATVERASLVIGEGRDGIYMNYAELINIRRTAEVLGEGRDGIHAKGCGIDCYHVNKIHGRGDKCIHIDECVGTVESVLDGYGAHYGLYAENDCDFRVFRSNIAGASPLSLYMNNSCRLFAKNVRFLIKDASVSEHCETVFEVVTVSGKFKSRENCKHDWLRTVIKDNADFKDTIYRWREVTIEGDHICDTCTGKVEKAKVYGEFTDKDSENHFSDYNLSGNINHIRCTTSLRGSKIEGMIGLTACTLSGEDTTVSQITDFTGSSVIYQASQVASIDGKGGSAYTQKATQSSDITLTDSAGFIEGGKTGSVTLTKSSFTQKSGEIGAVTATDSSFEQLGGVAGATDAANSGVTIQGGKIGSVTLSSSGMVQQGGTSGAISLGGSGLTAKGGTIGSVSGSGACEIISSSCGSISVAGTQTLPNCVPGMVVRVGSDKLYEVFDANVKRWFGGNQEEVIVGNRKLNVQKNNAERIDGNHQLDVGGTSDFTVSGTATFDSHENIVVRATVDVRMSGETGGLFADFSTTQQFKFGTEILRTAPLIQDIGEVIHTEHAQDPNPDPPKQVDPSEWPVP